MSPVQWSLRNERPAIEVDLPLPSGQSLIRCLIADTGAGTRQSVYQLVLHADDCMQCAGFVMGNVQLGGAYSGSFPVYLVRVRIVALNFDDLVPVVGVPQVPHGFDGIAGFKFLNRFHYGNFADPQSFGLQ